jgi:hypothetical protein
MSQTLPEPDDAALLRLATGALYRFSDWPNADVPTVAYGVYTVWLPEDALLYVGMSGRQAMAEPAPVKAWGLWTRLNSHASGYRSGDKFCIYVSDRLVIPRLSKAQLEEVGKGELSLDMLTRRFIRESLSYRFAVVADSVSAFRVERAVQSGALEAGKPLLNPR